MFKRWRGMGFVHAERDDDSRPDPPAGRDREAYSLAILWWGPERHMDGADVTELEHQRRMVSLRVDGVIAILCPVASDTLAGVAIMNVPPEEAREIMNDDPCVRARMPVHEVHPCRSSLETPRPRDPTSPPTNMPKKRWSGNAPLPGRASEVADGGSRVAGHC